MLQIKVNSMQTRILPMTLVPSLTLLLHAAPLLVDPTCSSQSQQQESYLVAVSF